MIGAVLICANISWLSIIIDLTAIVCLSCNLTKIHRTGWAQGRSQSGPPDCETLVCSLFLNWKYLGSKFGMGHQISHVNIASCWLGLANNGTFGFTRHKSRQNAMLNAPPYRPWPSTHVSNFFVHFFFVQLAHLHPNPKCNSGCALVAALQTKFQMLNFSIAQPVARRRHRFECFRSAHVPRPWRIRNSARHWSFWGVDIARLGCVKRDVTWLGVPQILARLRAPSKISDSAVIPPITALNCLQIIQTNGKQKYNVSCLSLETSTPQWHIHVFLWMLRAYGDAYLSWRAHLNQPKSPNWKA